MSRVKLVKEQIRLFHEIQSLGFNIVTCGNCATVLLHECKPISSNDHSVKCFECMTEMALCDCPDFWYDRAEENYK